MKHTFLLAFGHTVNNPENTVLSALPLIWYLLRFITQVLVRQQEGQSWGQRYYNAALGRLRHGEGCQSATC